MAQASKHTQAKLNVQWGTIYKIKLTNKLYNTFWWTKYINMGFKDRLAGYDTIEVASNNKPTTKT